jgi:hypothetical protein
MFVLTVKRKEQPFWKSLLGMRRDLKWVPLSDTKVKPANSGTTKDRGWWYSFKTKAAVKGKQEFERVNAKESDTFTLSIRERKTMAGLNT